MSATLYYLISGQYPASVPANQLESALQPASERKPALKKWQKQAILDGLILRADKRTQSMDIFRAALYHLPMPEEVRRRKRFIVRTVTVAVIASLMAILATLNFTYGLYLGDGIRYSLRSDGFHIVGNHAVSGTLELPESRFGIPVTRIGNGAFQGAERLQNLLVPGTIAEVGEFAFNDCKALCRVTLKDGVTGLHSQAFANCGSLQTVYAPDSLTRIEESTFVGSSERLTLIGNLDSTAEEQAVSLDIGFAEVSVIPNETGVTLTQFRTNQKRASVPDSINGQPVTEIGSGVEKVSVFPSQVQEIILPPSLSRIGDYAFFQTHIKQIALPETLEFIGQSAFSGTSLTTVTLPDSVAEMGESAFASCVKLESVTLSAGMKTIPGGCFETCPALRSVEIPKGIEEIEPLAFSQCPNLKNLELPSGIKRVWQGAFMDCISLEVAYLPSSLSYIHRNAFSGCPNRLIICGLGETYAHTFAEQYGYEFYDMRNHDMNLLVSSVGNLMVKEDMALSETIVLPTYFKETPVTAVLDAENLKSKCVILPQKTERIETTAFYGNQYLESVVCPDELKEIGDLTFGFCENLNSVYVGKSLEVIQDAAFVSCTSLTAIELPDSVRRIESGAFENCTALREIRIPSSLVLLDNDVFANTALSSVTVPGNVSKCRSAFYGCKNLKTAVLEEGVRALWGTFAECGALESVVIPSTVSQITRSTFKGCASLKDVWIYSDDAEFDMVWFATPHVEYARGEDGEIAPDKIYLEKGNESWLFSDSPNVTIHARRGSSAQVYAQRYGLNFKAIPGESAKPAPETQTRYFSSEGKS